MIERAYSRIGLIAILGLGLGATLLSPLLVMVFLTAGLILAVATLLRDRTESAVAVHFTVPDGALAQGDRCEVTITFVPTGEVKGLVEVDLPVMPGLEPLAGSRIPILSLAKGEPVEVTLRYRARARGAHRLGPVAMRIWDPSLLFWRTYRTGVTAEVRVAPGIPRLTHGVDPRRATLAWIGEIRSLRKGQGAEFHGIGEAPPGHPARRLNFRATARTGVPMANEFHADLSGDAVICIDAREVAMQGGEQDTVEHGIKVALGLTRRILEHGNRVGIILEENSVRWVFPGTGRAHLTRIHELLTRAGKGGKSDLSKMGRLILHLFPRGAHVILITPLLDSGSMLMAGTLLRKGVDLTIISPDPGPLLVGHRGTDEEEETGGEEAGADLPTRLSVSLLGMERAIRVRRLRSRTMVIDWDPTTSLSHALVRATPRRGYHG